MKRLIRNAVGLLLLSAVSVIPVLSQTAPSPQLVERYRYTIETGDQLAVTFQYTPEFNQIVTVQPDGYVTLEPIGQIKLSELTVAQATALITTRSSVHLKNPKVSLVLKQFHKPFFVVAGAIQRPGRYDMDQPVTALQAVLEAGGMSAEARSAQIIVFRRINADDDEVRVLNFHKMKSQSDLEHDMMLEPGDMILVPRDRLSKLDRIVKAANTGMYFNPNVY